MMKHLKVAIFIAIVIAIAAADHVFGWSGWIASGEASSLLHNLVE